MDWQKLFLTERKQGFLDSAVMGGLANFLLEQAASVPEGAGRDALIALAVNYQAANPTCRPQILAEIEAFTASIATTAAVGLKSQDLRSNQQPPVPEQRTQPKREAVALQYLKGVGPKRAAQLQRLGIWNTDDLLWHLPRDYEQRGQVVPISALQVGEPATIEAQVVQWHEARPNGRLHLLQVGLQDAYGMINAIWYNQPHIVSKLRSGALMRLYGKLEFRGRNVQFAVLDYQFCADGEAAPEGILPIYPATEGLTQKWFRSLQRQVLSQYLGSVEEILPQELLAEHCLMGRQDALAAMHFPASMEQQEQARRRLAYEELLLLQATILANRLPEKDVCGIARACQPQLLTDFCAALPYALTGAQQRAVQEIFADLESSRPMARLLQGDVGSGKTVVAAAALYKNARSGYLGVLMAPTEILAAQHYETLLPLFTQLGLSCALFTGSLPAKARRELQQRLLNHEIDVLLGTHTLIQSDLKLPRLGLAITDEQHRFGVMQRGALQQKGECPDTLVMTATPIPRTLALTLYGDLQLSVIDELPPGRQQIETFAVSYKLEPRVFKFLREQMDAGRQCYVVCPLVEESDKADLQAATVLAERLAREDFVDYRVGLLHGRLKPQQKESLMRQFAAGEVQLLVATTVIEVGINVPNATVMLIRDAQRFGLAQLHQLRGRVGRGSDQSYCILMNDAHTAIAKERLRVVCSSNDGFVLAEADLKLRGSGDILGTRQSGLPQIKVASLATDGLLLEAAHRDALDFLAREDWQKTALGRQISAKTAIFSS